MRQWGGQGEVLDGTTLPSEESDMERTESLCHVCTCKVYVSYTIYWVPELWRLHICNRAAEITNAMGIVPYGVYGQLTVS